MPNIIITDYCNLNCLYCFANNQSPQNGNNMSLDIYTQILDFCSAESSPIGIIGGEPTLHPEFKDILILTNKYCSIFNTRATLFTNGIELEQYLPYFGNDIDALININAPEEIGELAYNKLLSLFDQINNLCWINNRISCGVNLHLNRQSYNYIWDIVSRYNIQVLRVSIVSPCGCYNNMKKDKENYYNLMKPIFIKFCQEAEKYNCKLFLDCNYIPFCYFNDAELALLERVLFNIPTGFCPITIDIDSSLQAYPCYGSRNNEGIHISNFETPSQLDRFFFITNTIPKSINNNMNNKCKECQNHSLFKCQGGCLSFVS